jgi:hypothetical protein
MGGESSPGERLALGVRDGLRDGNRDDHWRSDPVTEALCGD